MTIRETARIPRRNMLSAIGLAAAGSGYFSNLLCAQVSPASDVVDRGSSIRLTSLEPHIFQDRVYLKLGTNHGVAGWGEVKGVVPTVAAELLRSMFELLKDVNPTRIEHIWQLLFRAERNQRGGAFMIHCISGVDMALWDLTGKLWGVPVYRLLGGPTRDRIRVYPSAKATKIGVGPKPLAADPADIEPMVQAVRQARDQVGADGSVMFDAHSAVPPATLIQFAAAIKPYDLLFLEEPAVPGNIEVFRRLKQEIDIPLAAGERDRTMWGILPYLTEGVLDIVQPDCGYTGGISQMKKIATIAEAYTVPLAPHCTQSYLGMTASFHVAASIPHLLIHESYDDERFREFLHPHWTKRDGYVSLPEGVGLCVDVDERRLEEAKQQPYRYEWRGPKYSADGSVTDY